MSPRHRSNLHDAIADALHADGCYVGEVGSLATQALVDAQWAAHVAARSLGLTVTVVIHHEKPEGQPARAVLWVATRHGVESPRWLIPAGSPTRLPA